MQNSNISLEIKNLNDRIIIETFNSKFNNLLNKFDDSTKHIIRNNKSLNEMYDLFLDFILDTSTYLKK